MPPDKPVAPVLDELLTGQRVTAAELPIGTTTAKQSSNAKISNRWGLGRVIFLSRRTEIEAAIVLGHPLTLIHATHGRPLGISYKNFTRYVRRYLKETRLPGRNPKAPGVTRKDRDPGRVMDPLTHAPHEIGPPRFRHSPIPRKREGLI